MIAKLSNVGVADNSGAGWVQAFHLYRGSGRRFSFVGDYIKGSVKVVAFFPRRKRGKRYKPIRVGHKVRGVLSTTNIQNRLWDDARVRFTTNSAVLIKKKGVFKSKYFFGPFARSARKKKLETLFPAVI